MARPLRIEFPDACYHVLNRGRRKETIFENSKDYQVFINLLENITQMFGVQINAYCLMPTHYHLFIQTPKANLARAMRHLNGIYTQKYNRRHACNGPLFKGRYKSILIDRENYTFDLVRYIHRNPTRGKLVSDIKEYPWSSHFAYLSNAKKWDWIFKKSILERISKGSKNTKTQYIDFITQPESEEVTDLLNRKKWPIALGSDYYISWLKSEFASSHRHSEIPDSRQLLPNIEKICTYVAEYFKVERSSFLHSQRGQYNLPRDLAIYLCRQYSGFSHKEIGKALNIDNHSTISSVITKINKQIKISVGVKKKVEDLFEQIKL